METDSSNSRDSVNSIPRPEFEALSAIDSPQPVLLLQGDSHDTEPSMPHKRQKYVVSAPPGSAAGSSNSSNSSPSSALGPSLTMKLTKVPSQPHLQVQADPKPLGSSTPKEVKTPKVPKEMVALQKSQMESEVLSHFVADGSKVKRRKSRFATNQLMKEAQEAEEVSSRKSSSSSRGRSKGKKNQFKTRSKSIPNPSWDGEDTDWAEGQRLAKKARQMRGLSMANDCGERQLGLDGEDSNSNSTVELTRSSHRSRSKSHSLSNSCSNEEQRPAKRANLRTENAEFAKKQRAFLDSIISDPESEQNPQTVNEVDSDWINASAGGEQDSDLSTFLEFNNSNTEKEPEPEDIVYDRLMHIYKTPPRKGWDPFCWKCRVAGDLQACSKCVRSFHSYCVRPATTKFDSHWKCPECLLLEPGPKRMRRNEVSADQLSQLLFFSLERMKLLRGLPKLRAPEDVLPETYKKFFVHTVSFETLTECIRNNVFDSADAFMSEVKWMHHNALILDSGDIKVETPAKQLLKVCREETMEIDTCPECYLNANSSDEWFVKVCRHPHLLLWAKLKGFPYWPAKAMGLTDKGMVNVRFFGKHDRAHVHVKDCFLYSAQNPNIQTSRRMARELVDCIAEVEVHIEHIKRKSGSFCYAPYRTPYDPVVEQQQVEDMMPGVYAAVDRTMEPANKTPLQFLIRKTAGDKLSIVKKTKATESGNESDQSVSPAKKLPPPPPPRPLPQLQGLEEAPASSSEHVKQKSNNYEVIPRSAESLTDSRCKVLLKRKNLAAKTTPPTAAGSMESPEVVGKRRKHSLSDTSGTSESSRREKHTHARKQQAEQEQARAQEQQASNRANEQEEKKDESSLLSGSEMHLQFSDSQNDTAPDPLGWVDIVRRRQGVTITKIPREQQQQQQQQQGASSTSGAASPEAAKPAPKQPPERAEAKGMKRSEVERQQEQLIKKVIPFVEVEVKAEVISEPEPEEEAPKPQESAKKSPKPAKEKHKPPAEKPQNQKAQKEPKEKVNPPQEPRITVPVPTPPPEPVEAQPAAAVAELVTIKEEILSEEEVEAETEPEIETHIDRRCLLLPQAMPPPPSQPLAVRVEAAQPMREETPTVRYVGDTSIQKISHKQAAAKAMDAPSKRRGVPYGPLPLSGQPSTSPAHSPGPLPVVKPPGVSGVYVVSKPPTPAPPNLRQKSDRNMNSTQPVPPMPPSLGGLPSTSPTTSSLLRSNMVVIPVEQANGCSLNSPMTIPVPPLRAVSKSTLQNSTFLPSIPIPPGPGLSSTSVSGVSMPPPLAGLSMPQMGTSTSQATSMPPTMEPGGLLANALNGLPNETLVSESRQTDSFQALNEILIRSGPPKLVPRPCGPLQSDGSQIYPSHAGPVSQRLKDNAYKITDYFISVIEDTLTDLGAGDQSLLQARITSLTLENERLRQECSRKISDMKRCNDQIVKELHKTLDQEHKRVICEMRQQSTLERNHAVDETKKKQWCANCMREAQLYCCWNTSYCDYPCQQMHWQRHSTTCGQAAALGLGETIDLTPPPVSEPTRSRPKPTIASPMATAIASPMATAMPVATPVPAPVPTPAPTPAPSNAIPTPQLHRTVTSAIPMPTASGSGSGGSLAGPAPKKWQNMSLSTHPASQESLLRQSGPLLAGLPSSTYVRPVVSATQPSSTSVSNVVNTTSLITPAPTSSAPHIATIIAAGPRNTINTYNYGSRLPTPQPMPMQHYNIPVPISLPNNIPYTVMAEQPPKPKSSGRRGQNRNRNGNSSSSSNTNNGNSTMGMRHNQVNQMQFQQ
ncbi:protein kinase C-binding protein 1 [Drosophila obscura]|uniref:protein kinase C-binding protein 1 n=1 Tax=Drosophila obscura TaxID=7282 RepID=UPI001BB1E526|nr:protein kinase C-binding protein 1 [Drosophila obscura]